MINILKILTYLIKYYNQSGTQLFKKYFKTLKNLPRGLNFLPHVFEKLDFFRSPIEFKKKQKIFLIFFFVNFTNFDLFLLEKLIYCQNLERRYKNKKFKKKKKIEIFF